MIEPNFFDDRLMPKVSNVSGGVFKIILQADLRHLFNFCLSFSRALPVHAGKQKVKIETIHDL